MRNLCLLIALFSLQHALADDTALNISIKDAARADTATTLVKPKPADEQLQRQLKPADASSVAARNNGPTTGPESECDRLNNDSDSLTWSSDGKGVKDGGQPVTTKPTGAPSEQRQRDAERTKLGCR